MPWLQRKEIQVLLVSFLIQLGILIALEKLTPITASTGFLIMLVVTLFMSWLDQGFLGFQIGYLHLLKALLLAAVAMFAISQLLLSWGSLQEAERVLYLVTASMATVKLLMTSVLYRCRCLYCTQSSFD
ncbi:hypothetical protein [Cohnella panacarvi]|uniref:hypothetical protein n=1 Tax=Cohnella panacarvi TaxID=400776 RepID=UPI00047D41FE|nr:hypothetical protein [Cohnella panacarvi]